MSWDAALALVMICIVGITTLALVTSKITDEERDEMLNDKDMWP